MWRAVRCTASINKTTSFTRSSTSCRLLPTNKRVCWSLCWYRNKRGPEMKYLGSFLKRAEAKDRMCCHEPIAPPDTHLDSLWNQGVSRTMKCPELTILHQPAPTSHLTWKITFSPGLLQNMAALWPCGLSIIASSVSLLVFSMEKEPKGGKRQSYVAMPLIGVVVTFAL